MTPLLSSPRAFLIVAALAATPSNRESAAAEPDLARAPIGLNRLVETGEYPRQVQLGAGRGQVMLRHWQERPASYILSPSKRPSEVPHRLALSVGVHGVETANYRFTAHFDVSKCYDRVVPFAGELYLAKGKDGRVVSLTRVTDDAPEEVRPRPTSRLVSLAEERVRIFHSRGQDRADEEFYYSLGDLKIQDGVATFDLVPMGTYSDHASKLKRERLSMKVRQGDSIAVFGRKYEVLNVVAPRRIGGFPLVGWIEIANDPTPAEPRADDR